MSNDINDALEIKSDPEENKSKKSHKEGGFLSFDIMVTPKIVKILYLLGIVFITYSGILLLRESANNYRYEEFYFVSGIALILFGNVFWRVTCERLLIIFKLHESALLILKELKSQKK